MIRDSHSLASNTPKKSMNKRHGFTIIELIVVIAVIAILAAILIVGYGSWRKTTATNEVKSDLNVIAAAMDSALNFGEVYPSTIPSTYSKSANIQSATVVTSSTGDFYCATVTSATDPTIAYTITSSSKELRIMNCSLLSDVTVGKGLVSWLKLNGNALDATGTNAMGSTTNVIQTTGQNGVANNAYAFNGASSWVTAPVPLLGTTNVTISTWINSPTTTNKGTFVKLGSASGGIGFGVGMGNTNFDNVGDKLIMLFENIRWIPTTTTVSTGWHHVVMRIDSYGTPTAYLDGSIAPGDYSGTDAITPDTQVSIGGYSGTTRLFSGNIDDTRIYNRALSSAEISALYSAGAR